MLRWPKFLYPFLIYLLFLFFVGTTFADTVGQRQNFYVNRVFDKFSRSSVSATLRQTSDKLYVYVEDDYWNSLSMAQQSSLVANITSLTSEFDSNIYPKEIQFWGSEPNPGIDNDPKITLLVTQLIKNNGGDFNSANEYSRSLVSTSNQREMMFMNSDVLSRTGGDLAKEFMAHEFQHLISFNQKELLRHSQESTWLNELRSEYSITLLGYNDVYLGSNLDNRVQDFLEKPSDSLTEWPNSVTDYAAANMVGEYLTERFGNSILSDTLKGSSYGIDSINKYLASHGSYENFGDVFVDWMGAVYTNNIGADPVLGYTRAGLNSVHVVPEQTIYLSPGLQEYNFYKTIKDWQPLWLEFNVSQLSNDPNQSFRVDVTGQNGQSYLAGTVSYYSNGQVRLDKINVNNASGTGFVVNSSDKHLDKVIVVATKDTKISDFGTDEMLFGINIKISSVKSSDVKNIPLLQDGMLIKRPTEKELYVISGKYKRYLNSDVVKLYGQLDPSKAVSPEPEVFDSYQTSNYVKYANDQKVYAVWPEQGEGSRGGTSTGIASGTKHWLHLTPAQWDASGRDWNAIFTISDLELNYYKNGVEITR